jgi:CobQ-like glutamine amidotransferase family enzyme
VEKKEETPPQLTAEQQAAAKAYESTLDTAFATAAGGADKVDAMVAWANANVDEASVNAFNAALDSGNAALAQRAIQVLGAAYMEANGKEPDLVKGAKVIDGPTAIPFKDTYEMTQAMGDPRYANSEAYRKEVAMRIAVSSF